MSGTLADVGTERIRIAEPEGATLTMQRLARGGTAFYRSSNGAWQQLALEAQIPAGAPACVETLMDGRNLLALKVFLGVGCGPT